MLSNQGDRVPAMYERLKDIPESFWDEPVPCTCSHDLKQHQALTVQTATNGFMVERFYCQLCPCEDFTEVEGDQQC